MTQQGGLADEFVAGGGNVLNPLILAGNPVSPLEAATKQYVDNSLLSLNINNLIGGTIPGNRFPAMNGDLVSSSGSANLVLGNTGVTPGTYAKVSVDNKGRVTNGMPLIESDIPSFSWNKITSDIPSTLSGYGITDALPIGGGTMMGQLSITGTSTSANELVNKNYLDSVIGGTTGIGVGDIITKIDATTPTGFLKCNGAEVEKSVYSDLYNTVGDKYSSFGNYGNGMPWKFQSQINNAYNENLNNWTAVQPLPGILDLASIVVTKNRVYILGGYNGTSFTSTVYTAQINNDGTIGPWSAGTSLPGALSLTNAIVIKNKVYILGGQNGTNTVTTAVYVADINADGTLGTWGNGPALPLAFAYSQAFVNKNKVYVVTGLNGGAAYSHVLSSVIKEDGSLESWVTEQPIPAAIYATSLLVTHSRVYIIGGSDTSVHKNTVYSAVLNSDGSIGSWSTVQNFPVTLTLAAAYVVKNYAYILGGHQTNSPSNVIYKALINTDGTLGDWVNAGTLPVTMTYITGNIVATKNHLYIISGYFNSAHSANVYYTDISGGLNDYSSYYSNVIEQNYMVAGSGKPWQQQYQINTTQSDDITGWVTDSSLTPNTNYRVSAVATKNRVYMIGGWNGTVAQNSVYSAPVNLDGTLDVWAAETNFPVGVFGGQLVAVGNKLYHIGGTNNSSYYASVYSCAINSDGTLGTWTVTANSLPVARAQGQVIVTRNRIYYLGGYNGGYLSTVYSAQVYPSGEIGVWTAGTNLPIAICHAQVFITKNRVYLIGGQTTGGTWLNNVYTAPVNADGTIGSWASGTSLPVALGESSLYVTKNTVYLLGGGNTSGPSLSVYKASINTDGVIGTWTAGTSLPGVINISPIVCLNNRIYLLGGANGVSGSNLIYSAPILEGSNDYSSYYAEDTTNYTYPGAGRPWESQYHFNTTQAGDITTWTTSATGVMNIYLHIAIVTKNRVYVGAGASNVMHTAPINSDGTLGSWTSLGAVLPVSPSYASAIVTKNRAFIIGYTGTNAILTAPINADGTLGTWSSLTNVPVTFSFNTTFVTKNKLYVVSGGGAGTNVYYADINADGTLGGWKLNPYSFPVTTNTGRALVTKNRVYFIGGNTGGGGVTTVYTAPISADGIVGSWTTGPSLLTGVEAPVILATKNTVIIGGGWTSGTQTNVSQIATINEDGTIGNWSYGTVFPMSFHSATPVITNGKVHLIGGAIASGVANSNIYTANFVGGLNDYSSYFNGDILPIEQFVTAAKFKLPDASFSNDNLNYFIKY